MKRYRRILYLVEGEPVRDSALQRVLDLAAAFEGRITLARLAGRGDDHADLEGRLRGFLAELETPVPVTPAVLPADPEELLAAIAAEAWDLVAKKAQPDDSLTRYLFGTLDTTLVERVAAPVLIEKPTPHERFARILAAVDLTDERALETLILDHAVSIARVERARVVVCHVWHLEGEEGMRGRAFTERARRAIERMKEEETRRRRSVLETLLAPFTEFGVEIALEVHEGPPALTIVETAERHGIDLVVMGTHVHSHLEGLALGSTAEAVLRRIRCALLAVKPPDFAVRR